MYVSHAVRTNRSYHVEDTSHPTSIITKEDTTKSCEGNDQVRANSDGGFDTLHVGRASKGHDTTTWHLDCGVAVRLLGKDQTSSMRLFDQEEKSRAATKARVSWGYSQEVGDPKHLISRTSSGGTAARGARVASGKWERNIRLG